MNHPLVRRKFRATFLSLELGPGYGDRVVENVEGYRSLAIHDTVLFCSRFFLSLPLLLRKANLFFHISYVIFFYTFLFRSYFPSPVFVFLSRYHIFFSLVSSFIFPSSCFLPHPRSISEIGLGTGVNIGSAISPGRQLLVIPLVSRGRWELDGAYSP